MPPASFDVLVCGSLHLDIVVEATALPRLDETVVGHRWRQVCGGKGGNQAVQAARAGARTAIVGRIGDDDFGTTLATRLFEAGVTIDEVQVDPSEGSGMSVAILQDGGEYGAVIVSGANRRLMPDDIAQSWQRLGGAAVLVLQNEIPHAVNRAAAQVARAMGARVVLNAAPSRPGLADLLSLVDVLVVNRVEAEDLFGRPVATRAEAIALLARPEAVALIGSGTALVVTLGGAGLVLAQKDQPPVEIAPVPVTVVSTHGAGDCFVGTLAARLAAGAGLEMAAREANAAAAAFVARGAAAD